MSEDPSAWCKTCELVAKGYGGKSEGCLRFDIKRPCTSPSGRHHWMLVQPEKKPNRRRKKRPGPRAWFEEDPRQLLLFPKG